MNYESNESNGLDLSLLDTEVAFWREMINESNDQCSPESLERMQYALALAEKRIAIRNRSVDHE